MYARVAQWEGADAKALEDSAAPDPRPGRVRGRTAAGSAGEGVPALHDTAAGKATRR